MGTSVTLSSGPNDFDPDQKSLARPGLMTTITTMSVGKRRPPPLSPPISVFSTYKQKTKMVQQGGDMSQSRAPGMEAESSKASFSSLEVGWQSSDDGGLPSAKHLQKEESREKLVNKGTI